ncbi:MAG: serine/threonine protein kinase [Planctomycetes bacterium]|nr:serine/threonine protein kinase [Planctomycetota bacterium]
MGEVYRARHFELGTAVAIKVMRSAEHGPARPVLAERFRREALAAARVDHPCVVRVLDVGEDGGVLWIAMEWIEGEPLHERLSRGPMEARASLAIALSVARGLAAAHQAGVVHRDIKPSNILIDRTGEPRIVDFGLSKTVFEDLKLTASDSIVGTPAYMSPEMVHEQGNAVDGRADVYSLGLVLYEMLTWVCPMAGSNLYETLLRVETLEPPPPSRHRPGLCGEIDRLVLAAIAKDKEERPASAAFASQIATLLGEERGAPVARATWRRLPWSIALPAVALLCVAAASWVIHRQTAGPESRPDDRQEVPSGPCAAVESVRQAIGLRRPEDRALRRNRLLGAVEELSDARTGEDLYGRAIARKYLGDFAGAHRDMEAAAEAGFAPALGERIVTWILDRKLFAPLVCEAEWLTANRPEDVAGWVAALPADLPEADRVFYEACAALARGECERASQLLAPEIAGPGEAPDREVVAALSEHASFRWDEANRLLREGRERDPGYAPLLLLQPFLDETWSGPRASPFVEASTPSAQEPYLALAWEAFLDRDREALASNLSRAAQRGGGPRVAAWKAALSLRWWAIRSPETGIEDSEARAWLGELDAFPLDQEPGAQVSRLLLLVALGEVDRLSHALVRLPELPDLGEYLRWREAREKGEPCRHYYHGWALATVGRASAAVEALELYLGEAENTGRAPTELLSSAHESLAAEVMIVGPLSDPAVQERALVHMEAAVRMGGGLYGFPHWTCPVIELDTSGERRSTLARMLLKLARQGARAQWPPPSVLQVLGLSLDAGTPWSAVAEDPAFAPFRPDSEFESLREKYGGGRDE